MAKPRARQPKTRKNTENVEDFIRGIEDDQRRQDTRTVVRLMRKITGKRPAMWGPSIVGFGSYHYRYASGREGDWFLTGVAPRKQALTLYIMPGFEEFDELRTDLGKHQIGKSCLYIKKLDDVDLEVLESLVRKSVAQMQSKYGET